VKRIAQLVIAMFSYGALAATSPQPMVKIIGDSISKGYLPTVQAHLHGEFKVSHACKNPKLFNCNNGQTSSILNNLNYYFAAGNPDIITFNSGIHDMSKALTALKMPCSTATEMTPPDLYYQRLSKIADRLKNRAKIVIWIDTTSLPSSLCASTHLEQYNAIGEKVAHEHNFYVLRPDSKFHDKSGIHFTFQGYEFLGSQVAECITIAWEGRHTDQCFRN